MIRFIVITYSSQHDVNGNSYHFSKVISTKTSETVLLNTDGDRNVSISLQKELGYDSENGIYTETIVLPKREWLRRVRSVEFYDRDQDFKKLIDHLEKA